jgi:hypothetical protein
MSLTNSVVYLIGAALIVVALLIALPRRGHSFRARDIHGNTFVGNVNNGSVSQDAAAPVAAPPSGTRAKSRPDKVAWIIAMVGVLVALAQLGHDLLLSK